MSPTLGTYTRNPKAWLGTCVSGPYSRPRSYWLPVAAGMIFAGAAILLSLYLTGGQ